MLVANTIAANSTLRSQNVIGKGLAVGLLVLIVAMCLTLLGPGNWVKAATATYVESGESIQDAVDAASDGDIIFVGDGTYTENVIIDKQITILSENGAGSTTIQADDSDGHVFTVLADTVTIDGFTITGASNFDKAGIYLASDTENCTISNNICFSNYEGIYLEFSKNNTLFNNTTNSNTRFGIWLDSSEGNTVIGNIASSNETSGICIESSFYNSVSNNIVTSNTNYGIYLVNCSDNAIAHNISSNNNKGICLSDATYNTISGNTCSNNTQGISLSTYSDDNTIFLNNFTNTTNVVDSSSANYWYSLTNLCYAYENTQYKDYLGNYYDDYSGSDADADGLGDTAYDLQGLGSGDDYPLMDISDNYPLNAWYLSNPVMHKGNMTGASGSVTLGAGESEIWIADFETSTDIAFPKEIWSGQITFILAPAKDDSFTVEIGCSANNGVDFNTGVPTIHLKGNGNITTFIFETETTPGDFTVPADKYLAYKLTNDSNADYDIQVGGTWSYISSPATTQDYPDSSEPINATVITPVDGTAYDISSIPSSFSGQAADNDDGTGLNVNSTSFTLKRGSDNNYWNGGSWTSSVIWLTTTHEVTIGNTVASWISNTDLPTWEIDTYSVQAKATDNAGNTSVGTVTNFTFGTSHNITIDIPDYVNSENKDSVPVTITSDGDGTYTYTVSNGTGQETGSGSITDGIPIDINLDLSEFADGTITADASIEDAGGITSDAIQDTAIKDTVVPEVTIDDIDAFVPGITSIGGTGSGSPEKVRVMIKSTATGEYWDGSSWRDTESWIDATGTDTWDYIMPILDDDVNYTVKAKSIDEASNESLEAMDKFTVDITAPVMTVTIPNGGEYWAGGNSYDIIWETVEANKDTVEIEYSPHGGDSWVSIEFGVSDTGTYSWAIPDGLDISNARVRVTAIDKAGNSTSGESAADFIIDSTSPVVTITSPADGDCWAGGSTHDIIWDTTDVNKDTVDIEYSTDGGADWVSIESGVSDTGTYSWAVPSDVDTSTARVKITAVDEAGNSASGESAADFSIDSTLPVVTITSPTDGDYWAGGISCDITWDTTDVNKNIVDIEYSTDGGTDWVSIESGVSDTGTYSWAVPSDVDTSTARIKTTAVDKAGNSASDESDADFTIDSMVPDISVNSPNGGEILAGESSYDITWIAIDGNMSDDPITIDYYNGTDWIEIAIDEANDGTYSWTIPSDLDTSSAKVRITVIDKAGNSAARESDADFTIDSTLPIVTVTGPNGGEFWAGGSSYEITWETTETNKKTIDLEYSVNNGDAWISIKIDITDNGIYSWTVPDGMNVSDAIIRITATDEAGNSNSDESDTGFTIDSTPPLVTINNIGNVVNSLPSIVGTADDAVEVDKVQVWIKNNNNDTYWDGASWQASAIWVDAEGTTSWTCNVTNLEDSDYTIKAKSVDVAGNMSSEASDDFIYDISHPTGYGPITPEDNATDIPVKFTLVSSTASDTTSHVHYYFQVASDTSFKEDLQGSGWQIDNTTWSPSIVLNGGTEYYWRVQAKDSIGNESDWSSVYKFTTLMTTTVLASSGGYVEGLDGKVKLNLPAGAVNSNSQISIKSISNPPSVVPLGFMLGETFFKVEAFAADGAPITTLEQAMTIVVDYSDGDVDAAGGNASYLRIAYWDELSQQWQELDTTIDKDNNTVAATTTHLSTWGLLVSTSPGAESGGGISAWVWVLISLVIIAIGCAVGYFVWRKYQYRDQAVA